MADSCAPHPHGRQSGVTLIELVITIVIVSVAIAGVVGGYSLVVGRSADTLYQSRTTALGQAYLDEILARRFDKDTGVGGIPAYDGDCRVEDPPAGIERDEFEVVDYYNTINNESPKLVSDDPDASTFGSSDYSDYKVTVEVNCISSGELKPVINEDDAKRINVTVDPPQGPKMEFTVYKGNF